MNHSTPEHYNTLISVEQLARLKASGKPLMVFDCSFDLMNPTAGHEHYLQTHIPEAVFADLDKNLSAAHGVPGENGLVATSAEAASGGRHPLPSRERFAVWLSSVGFANDMQAVVYDRNGCNYCGRLWWMLRWAGHDAVAVLDGGLQAWQAAGQPLSSGEEPGHFQSNFELGQPLETLKTVDQVETDLGQATQTLIDARAPARYRGEVEPLDPVAGHIPGALNRPFASNIAADGRFKPAALLKAEFEQLLAGRDPASVVHQCGSGVSATPNVLAMRIAGFAPTALFAGSWSEWCSLPSRPVERG
ncbi:MULTISPECIES: sulfurtransferase [Comamonas]|jgi:thiosulfate/3-mercaptopyruvate sulfurtransferase|uniref:sulfurtransferase n=1 Tax=Comamonas TaxID=283 RepID=UPI0025EAF2BD|nr:MULTISPECIES: sulfurtransferase [Comamonas]MDR3064247.1 sulfurtransferase [Comamonas sp.]MEB5964022.1 sulfurtransferase [Comamonas testosteroni]